MATIEVKEPEVINAEFVDNNIAPENNLPLEVNANDFTPQNLEQVMKNKGVERVPIIDGAQQQTIDPMTIDPRILYQTAEQYEIAAQKMGQLRDGFAQQAQDTEQKRLALELSYKKSAKPFGVAETTAATVAGAVIVPKLGEIFLDNVYNPEKMAQDGLNAAVDAMGKKTNLNPLNWFSNLVNGSYNVENMQHHVEEAITNVSGKNLANAITLHTDDMIQAAGIDGQTQKAFNELDKNFIKISKLPSNNKLFDKAERLINNVTNKVTAEMKPELHGLSSSISTVDPLNKTKDVLLQSVELSYEAAKDAAIQAVNPTNGVNSDLLGNNAREIKQAITDKAGGIEKLAEKAKEDLHGNKIAEGIMWGRDKFKNARPEVQAAIVASGIVISGILSYLAANEISKRRRENLNHIDEQIVATEAEQQLWTQRVGQTHQKAMAATDVSNNIRNIADWKTKIELGEVSVGGKGF
jgi:hypothetical protein